MRAAPLRIVSPGQGLDRVDCPRIGHLLVQRRLISRGDLDKALGAQTFSQQKLGDILIAHGTISPLDLCEVLAEQWGLGAADLDREAPDDALINPDDFDAYLAHGILPWRAIGGLTAFVVSDPERADQALNALGSTPPIAFVLLAPRDQIHSALRLALPEPFADRAANQAPGDMSVRTLAPARRTTALALAASLLALSLGGPVAIICGLLGLFALNASTTILRIAALFASQKELGGQPLPAGALDFVGKRAPPVVSLLVPLYREGRMVASLISALERIDYPRELLEVLILVETSDVETRETLSETNLPPWIKPIIVPEGSPRTKPRALNHAMEFCRGEIVGILDAEDHPAADQISRVVDLIRQAPPEVACVQCQLSYFNAGENWLSRCFQLEYSIWFDVLLRGFQALRLPIPLGGTSVYFRRSALRDVGGWDAHNVTEDADLGMRLARAGFRCAVSHSITLEEANCRALPWIRQRSRWLKGYLLTWLSHMRAPVRLWRDLGPMGFFGLNILFLGAATTYLAAPLFWVAVFCWLTTGETVWGAAVPGWAVWPAGMSLAIGQITMLACAVLAMRRRAMLKLLVWVPTLPFYWTLGAIAAWKAILELIVAPYYWDKTKHGLSRFTPRG